MKKIFIILFITFISFFSISSVFADDSGTYTYVSTIQDCNVYYNQGTNFLTSATGHKVFVYKIEGASPVSIKFNINANTTSFWYRTSNSLFTTCSSGASNLDASVGAQRYLSASPTTDYYYTIQTTNTNYYNGGPVYVYFKTDNNEMISWGDGSTAEPEVPEPQDLIYVPESDTYNKCYVVQSEGVIRGYDTIPVQNASYRYRDYYVRSSYISRDGSGSWSSYSTLPICLDSELITNSYYYRIDFPQILLMFLVINIFAIYIPIKVFSKLFRKGGI